MARLGAVVGLPLVQSTAAARRRCARRLHQPRVLHHQHRLPGRDSQRPRPQGEHRQLHRQPSRRHRPHRVSDSARAEHGQRPGEHRGRDEVEWQDPQVAGALCLVGVGDRHGVNRHRAVAFWRPVVQGPDVVAMNSLIAATPPVCRAEQGELDALATSLRPWEDVGVGKAGPARATFRLTEIEIYNAARPASPRHCRRARSAADRATPTRLPRTRSR